ncbi:leucine-rich repeat and IQ domain-containing protein 1 [Suncus etruscus]|uniref:leucine-rich repeat and IQ domain-containing protein 1 n=1 Tax=Suncus etruscus TaxID=109475 RepID=UPI00210F8B60|nr:leucine-rich repeat and IQ domain-containing protein 1 [Suncus etruscus]
MDDYTVEEANLNEEIEAELEKISISSLEKYVDSDSPSETQSDENDTTLVKLPDSVLQCINTIEEKSDAVEDLILQDLEDSDVLDCKYGAVSNDNIHLRIELRTEYNENPRQLMKILAEIEKEEFLRSKIHGDHSDSVLEPHVHEPPTNDHAFTDDPEIHFEYCEVEERCKQSFEAWQDKQKELEDQRQEIFKTQRDKERRQFQEEEEKRYCWMKQFEMEKKKLEDIYRQEQDNINEELHKQEKIWKEKFKQHEEFIRRLNLQIQEERTSFKEIQEKERAHLLKVQHFAAVKIQATYKGFSVHKKYGPIIKKQLEAKKRKAWEWKEKEAKIRNIEKEQLKRLEEKQSVENQIRKQKEEERKEREKEYVEKKMLLRQEKGQQLYQEKLRFREHTSKQLMKGRELKQGRYSVNYLTVTGIVKDKNDAAKNLEDNAPKKWGYVPLCLVEELKSRENLCRHNISKESSLIQLKDLISSKKILTELKVEEKLENLAKQQCSGKSVKQEKNGNLEKMSDLENQDLKENAMEWFQLQEVKLDTQKEETVKNVIKENLIHRQETQIILFRHNEAISEMGRNEPQDIVKDNQETKVLKVEKDVTSEQDGIAHERNILVITSKPNPLPIKIEESEVMEKNEIMQNLENDLKHKETSSNLQNNAPYDHMVFYTSDNAKIKLDEKVNKQDFSLDSSTVCNDLGGDIAKNNLVLTELNSPLVQSKRIPEPCHENSTECGRGMTCSLPERALLLSIQEKKLEWEKSFKPWLEIFKQNQQKKISKRKRPQKCFANILPPLNTLEILQHGPWDTLMKVTKVTFQDLPNCSISTLAECSNLQFLSLQRCGLTSLDSLSNCKKLKYIDAQENHIEAINCEDLENLSVVLLNKNQLTSLHGLDGCINIQSLELSHNKITRIAGLESLKNLQHLIVNHNRLISTKGLCHSPTIISLDCSHNHLTEIQGIEHCGLLQTLKLQGNYLSELPPLENHVLLRELHLDDNSISTVEAFSLYWLPLLQNLTLSQNSLTKIIPLSHFISLEILDVSNNCLSDLAGAQSWFDSCYSLRELSLTGNPILQEINWRDVFTWDSAEKLDLYFKKMMALSIEYRCAHEHRKGKTDRRVKPATPNRAAANNRERTLNTTDVLFGRQGPEQLGPFGGRQSTSAAQVSEGWERSQASITELPDHGLLLSKTGLTPTMPNGEQNTEYRDKTMAALVIQDYWHHYIEHKQTSGLEACIKNKIVLKKEESDSILNKIERESVENSQELRENAAIIIQAFWKGFILRKKLALALEAIENEESEDEYEEIDLENFMFDEAAFEKEWQASEPACIPSQTLLLPDQLHWPKFSETLRCDDSSLSLPNYPAQVRLCNEKENLFSPEHTHLNSRLEYRTSSWTPESKYSRRSLLKLKKEEKVSEEWGFKDISTAQQMLRRARKMKSTKLRKKLDPTVRLALFKSNENKVSLRRSPKKGQLRKDSPLDGKEELIYKNTTGNEKAERNKEYTYQWLHMQVKGHKTSSRNMKGEHFLPELDPEICSGGRVQLVARLVSREDTDLDLFSMSGGSALSVKREKKNQAHRHSAGSSSKLWFPSELI